MQKNTELPAYKIEILIFILYAFENMIVLTANSVLQN